MTTIFGGKALILCLSAVSFVACSKKQESIAALDLTATSPLTAQSMPVEGDRKGAEAIEKPIKTQTIQQAPVAKSSDFSLLNSIKIRGSVAGIGDATLMLDKTEKINIQLTTMGVGGLPTLSAPISVVKPGALSEAVKAIEPVFAQIPESMKSPTDGKDLPIAMIFDFNGQFVTIDFSKVTPESGAAAIQLLETYKSMLGLVTLPGLSSLLPK